MKLTLTLIMVASLMAGLLAVSHPVFAQAVMQKGDVPGVKLGPDQRNQVYNIRQETRREIRKIMNDPKLTEEQKDAKITQALEENRKRVLAVLTPQQRQQFEAWWQSHVEQPIAARGAGTGAGPIGEDALLFKVPGVDPKSMTDSQKNKIAQIRLNSLDQIDEIENNPKLSEDQKIKQTEQVRIQRHSDVMAVLTPQQRKQFQDWWGAK